MSGLTFQASRDFSQPKLSVLLQLTEPLFIELNELSSLANDSNLAALLEKFKLELKRFETRAFSKNLNTTMVQEAHYILCSFIDEAVLHAHFTQKYFWSQQNLLSFFHNDTHGGENFFIILEEVLQNVHTKKDLLELIYACLAMGFQGKYRIVDQGTQELERLYQNVGQVLNAQLAYPVLKLNAPQHLRKTISWVYWVSRSWWLASLVSFLAIIFTYVTFNHYLQVHTQNFKVYLEHSYRAL
jgi:type VI secretion system protein ImpK